MTSLSSQKLGEKMLIWSPEAQQGCLQLPAELFPLSFHGLHDALTPTKAGSGTIAHLLPAPGIGWEKDKEKTDLAKKIRKGKMAIDSYNGRFPV